MRNETSLKAVVAVLALVTAVIWSIAGYEAASAGHTIASGNCVLGPVCVSGYPGTLMDKQESFRVANYRGDSSWWFTNGYEAALRKTERAWATAAGPHVPSDVTVVQEPAWVNLTYDNFYIDCVTQGDPAGVCGPGIINAYVCWFTEEVILDCSPELDEPEEFLAQWSVTHMNTTKLDDKTLTELNGIIAHEFGHTMLLVDKIDTTCLMAPPGAQLFLEPQDCDLGFADPFAPGIAPPCVVGDESNWGLRCIYGWWREQSTEPFVDCHDLNRDGRVDLLNDILGTILLYSGNVVIPPEQRYQPEADTNRDGKVDLPNDILGTILDYGDNDPNHCDNAHYPNA